MMVKLFEKGYVTAALASVLLLAGASAGAAATAIDPEAGSGAWGEKRVVSAASADYHVLIFTNVTQSWSFNLPPGIDAVEYLVVAGGGGGGSSGYQNWSGSGGGAGGLLHEADYTVTGGENVEVTVGAGGAGATYEGSLEDAKNGKDSILKIAAKTIHATGGGAGCSADRKTGGGSGGSGGGGHHEAPYGMGLAGQGHEGSKGRLSDLYIRASRYAGAGGGAGEPGGELYVGDTEVIAVVGGEGLPFDITGEQVWYASGGGGGVTDVKAWKNSGGKMQFRSPRTKGGGGCGCGFDRDEAMASPSAIAHVAEDGVDGKGGGGGGGSFTPMEYKRGGNGGSGVVIIRYKKPENPGPTGKPDSSAVTYGWTAAKGIAWANSDNWDQGTTAHFGYPNDTRYGAAKFTGVASVSTGGKTDVKAASISVGGQTTLRHGGKVTLGTTANMIAANGTLTLDSVTLTDSAAAANRALFAGDKATLVLANGAFLDSTVAVTKQDSGLVSRDGANRVGPVSVAASTAVLNLKAESGTLQMASLTQTAGTLNLAVSMGATPSDSEPVIRVNEGVNLSKGEYVVSIDASAAGVGTFPVLTAADGVTLNGADVLAAVGSSLGKDDARWKVAVASSKTWELFHDKDGIYLKISDRQDARVTRYISTFDITVKDSNGGYASCDVGAISTDRLSISGWFKLDEDYKGKSNYDLIFGMAMINEGLVGGPMGIILDPSKKPNNLCLYAYEVGDRSGMEINHPCNLRDGKWHFAVATYDKDEQNLIFYLDGVEVGRKEGITGLSSTSTMFCIGRTPLNSRHFDGAVTEVVLWGRALDAAFVGTLWKNRVRMAGDESGLLAYWPLTEHEGGIYADRSGNGRDMTYSGNIRFEEGDGPFESGVGMFSRIVPTASWTYDRTKRILVSTDGWTLQPTMDGRICYLACQSATGHANETGSLDLTGFYEALTEGDHTTYGVIDSVSFNKNGAGTIRNIYLDGGDWMASIPAKAFPGDSLTALTNVTILVSRPNLSLGAGAFSAFASGLGTLRIKASTWHADGGAPFENCPSLGEIYWLAPPPNAAIAEFFTGCGADGIVNYVDDNEPGWARLNGVTGLKIGTRGRWRGVSGAEANEQLIEYRDYFDGHDIDIANCKVVVGPKDAVYIGAPITLSATVTIGSRRLAEGIHYTVGTTPPGSVRMPGDYVVRVAAIPGSGYVGYVDLNFTVGEGSVEMARSDMFARLVPDCTWWCTKEGDEYTLCSTDGWVIHPTQMANSICNLQCDATRTSGEAKKTGHLDFTGAVEAIIAANNGTWPFGEEVKLCFGGCENNTAKGVSNTSFNKLLKNLYLDCGTYVTNLVKGGFSGAYITSGGSIPRTGEYGALTSMTNVTIVSKHPIQLERECFYAFVSEFCRLQTIRIQAPEVIESSEANEFNAVETLEAIYWNCPPISMGKATTRLNNFFNLCAPYKFVNYVSLDYLGGWKGLDAATSSTITDFSETTRGVWKSGRPEYIQAYDFSTPIGFAVIVF